MMSCANDIQLQFVQDFGEAYSTFGLPRLMGHIVGLLLFKGEALSLDEITVELKVSKGPVSQITRRLRENGLLEKQWVPGSRKDYYRVESDIFGKAFANQMRLFEQNLVLAQKYSTARIGDDEEIPEAFTERIAEMTRFYTMMSRHMTAFMKEWLAT
ncbi:MAG: MarR family transcriptional regulator [bacterium]|nr:MarR family transcriptional regulator [bacterium]